MIELQKIGILGLGLIGASVALAASRVRSSMVVAGYAHRGSTRRKAADMGIVAEIFDDPAACVAECDMVILATPIRTFPELMKQVRCSLKPNAIVTDVGSTKVLPHRWAREQLRGAGHYVGSHPIAGSEKRGLEFARDDLFYSRACILTHTPSTDKQALECTEAFWQSLGSRTLRLTPQVHDRILGQVSHLPHAAAATMLNTVRPDDMKYAGTGFLDTSRVASGPANVWTDILMTNAKNLARSIKAYRDQLEKLQEALENEDEKSIYRLLEKARTHRADLLEYKMQEKEIL